TIGKLNPNEMERVYNKCAIKVSNKEITNAKGVFDNLKSIYVDDETFENSFSSISIDIGKRKLIKYILVNIENQIANSDYSYDENGATIEHILPQSIEIDSKWSENFSDEEMENFNSRLGNYLLLEVDKNREAGNRYFDEKIEVYKTSSYLMTKDFNYKEWNSEKIKQHQKEFAKIAKSIWKIN
ncbi:MAG: HNH endonuclease, partial [Campylobacterales bacterium]|nr:HNH endonuclease [Campylobacterales bacterium]